MSEHFCQFIVDWNDESEGEPIFCDKPAGIKYDGAWFCGEHYDEVVDDEKPKNWLIHDGTFCPGGTPDESE